MALATHFKLDVRGRTLVMIDWANVHGWFSRPSSSNFLGWEIDPQRLFDYISKYPNITEHRLYHGTEVGNSRSEKFGIDVTNIGYNFQTKDVKWAPVFLNEEGHFKDVVKKLFDVLDGVKVTNSEIATKLYELREKIDGRLAATETDFDGDGNVQGVFPAYKTEDQAVYDSVYELIEELDSDLRSLNDNIGDIQSNLKEPVKRRKCDFDVEIARDTCNMAEEFDTLILFSGDGDYSALVHDLILKGKKVIVVFAKGHIGKEYGVLNAEVQKMKLSYRLFLCDVRHLENELSIDTTIPPDFSGGRDFINLT